MGYPRMVCSEKSYSTFIYHEANGLCNDLCKCLFVVFAQRQTGCFQGETIVCAFLIQTHNKGEYLLRFDPGLTGRCDQFKVQGVGGG